MSFRPVNVALLAALMLAIPAFMQAQTRHATPQRAKLRTEPSIKPETTRYAVEVFRNSSLHVLRFDIPARESAHIAQRTRNYLLIALNPVSMKVTGGNTSLDFDLHEGDMQIVSGGWPHLLSNKSDEAAHVVAIEISTNIDAEHATCGLSSASCNEVRFAKTDQGEYSQAALFETSSTKIFRVDLGPKSILKLHTDTRSHLIIALNPLSAHSESDTLSLESGKVHWIFSGFDSLTNDGSDAARFLILELK